MSKYLLESSSVDGYQLEDGSGSYLTEANDDVPLSQDNSDQARNSSVIISF